MGGTGQKLLLSLKSAQIAQNCYHVFIINLKFLQDSIRIELQHDDFDHKRTRTINTTSFFFYMNLQRINFQLPKEEFHSAQVRTFYVMIFIRST